nr:DUF364 domain-containing protein [Clostridioides difficile]
MTLWELYDDLIEGIPKDIIVEDIAVGQHNILVRSSVGSGIGFVYNEDGRPPEFVKSFKGKSLHEIARCVKSWNITESGIGLAAINSYYNSVKVSKENNIKLNENNFIEDRINDPFISYQNMIRGKKVAVIGHFHYLEQLFAPVCDLSIIESENIYGDYPETSAPYILPEQDFVVISCYTLSTKTFPWYLELSKNAYVVLVGPATPMAPILFKYGVNDLSGFVIKEHDKVMSIISGNERNNMFYSTGQKVNLKGSEEV